MRGGFAGRDGWCPQRQQPEYTRDNDWPFGGWQRDMPEGIRPYPYSTKMEVNPTTYEYINTDDYSGVHAKGCVWANALYEGYWNIVEAEGFSPDLYSREGGNGMVLQVSRTVASAVPPCAGVRPWLASGADV